MSMLLAFCLMALLTFGLTFVLAEWAAAHCLRRRGLVFEDKTPLQRRR
jgi:lipopolysaccharide export LptBFGC system permease protein LptF